MTYNMFGGTLNLTQPNCRYKGLKTDSQTHA